MKRISSFEIPSTIFFHSVPGMEAIHSFVLASNFGRHLNPTIMPCTTINNLRKDAQGNLLETAGSANEYGALYYFEDIRRVFEQTGFDGNFRLVQKNVRFEWPSGNINQVTGEPLYDITVLAAEHKQTGELLSIVAPPWPPYYKTEINSGTDKFPGSDDFVPGQMLV